MLGSWFSSGSLNIAESKKNCWFGLVLFGNFSESNDLPFQLFQQILKNQQFS